MAFKFIYEDAYYGTNPSCSIMVDSESDLENIPNTVPPGSLAYTAGYQAMWQKGLDGNWVSIV